MPAGTVTFCVGALRGAGGVAAFRAEGLGGAKVVAAFGAEVVAESAAGLELADQAKCEEG